MGGSLALIWFLFTLTSYMPCSGQGIFAAKFSKTSVISEVLSVRMAPMFTDPVKNNHECSQLCTRDYGCRKYMITTDITTNDKLCYRYSDGENCVAAPSELSNKQSVCYRKLKQSDGTTCVSPVGYYGSNCENIIKDCYDGKIEQFNGTSLSYVKPADKIIEVLCDFDNGNTMIQVRRPDSVEVNFTRTWDEYVNGFGYTHSEYWLGLQNIYDLTHNPANFNLEIIINEDCFLRFYYFKLEDNNDFVVSVSTSVSPFIGVYCPPLYGINEFIGAKFVNYDRPPTSMNCFIPQDSGWWYKPGPCTLMNLNNPRTVLNPFSDVIMRLAPA